MKLILLILLASDPQECIGATEQRSRRLRKLMYNQDEVAQDSRLSVFTLVEVGMSMPSPSPSIAISKTPAPTEAPVSITTGAPTRVESSSPTTNPSAAPSKNPTMMPTARASEKPSTGPSAALSLPPSVVPTSIPTFFSSGVPTIGRSETPSHSPSILSSLEPSTTPSSSPTLKCNLSVSARAALISIFVRAISTSADVDTPGSPQNLAADWIINRDPFYICPQDTNLNQRYTMAVFYYSTRGDRWTQCSAPLNFEDQTAIDAANTACTIAAPEGDSNAWLTPSSECSWGGLACDDGNYIVRIDFEQNGIAGTLPFELKVLSKLRFLLLEEGVLTGIIPSQIGEIDSLEQIDLNFNLLTGEIPDEIYSLINLRQLDLNDNQLEGTVSTRIAALSSLSFFQIENNNFTGVVPSELGAMRLLEVATMENNMLSGIMPAEVCANVSGTLEVLTVDCLGAPNRPSPPLVICDCCTGCF